MNYKINLKPVVPTPPPVDNIILTVSPVELLLLTKGIRAMSKSDYIVAHSQYPGITFPEWDPEKVSDLGCSLMAVLYKVQGVKQ